MKIMNLFPSSTLGRRHGKWAGMLVIVLVIFGPSAHANQVIGGSLSFPQQTVRETWDGSEWTVETHYSVTVRNNYRNGAWINFEFVNMDTGEVIYTHAWIGGNHISTNEMQVGETVTVSGTRDFHFPKHWTLPIRIGARSYANWQWEGVGPSSVTQVGEYSGVGSGGSSDLSMRTPISYSFPSANQIRLNINRISNFGSGRSGTLRVTLYAFEDRYNGGSISGVPALGSHVLGSTLSSNAHFSNLQPVVTYTRPPFYGRYYTTMVLSEHVNGRWLIRDTHNLSGSALLGSGNPNRTLPQFGELQPGSHPRWYIDRTLGHVFLSGNGHWTYSADLDGWIHADPGGLSWSPVFGRVNGSGNAGWMMSNVFGWVHFGNAYGGWVFTERFGWMWRQESGGTTWLWTESAGWMGVASDGSNFLWSVNQGRWLAPLM